MGNGAEVDADCVIVGASFAGLACATALAQCGWRATVLEKKADVGAKLHTTGILVKDAIDQVPLLQDVPAPLVRRIASVRLYAPSLASIDLSAPEYYFLATDTPNLMRWLARRAEDAGVRIVHNAVFSGAVRTDGGFDLGQFGTARYLVGADGPRSAIARTFALGRNRHFLFGIEHEYHSARLAEPDFLHCFLDRRLARGYIAWVVAGPTALQVGLAHRMRRGALPATSAMTGLLDKIAPIVDLRTTAPDAIRAGLIPCGGLVSPVAAPGILLVGDAAGMVSPVTAGGIHTALKHGLAAGHAISEHLAGRADDPWRWFVHRYPRFRTKRALRFLFDHFQSDALFELLLRTRVMREAAAIVYFHRKGVFDREEH